MVAHRTRNSLPQRTQHRCIGAVCVTLAAFLFTAVDFSSSARAQDTVATSEKILQSLALVVGKETGAKSFGSAFCFYSNPSKSYFVTNWHVVFDSQSIFLRPPNSHTWFSARVYPRRKHGLVSDNIDLAILVVDVGKLSCVSFHGMGWPYILGSNFPPPGTPVGVAGYPAVRLYNVGQGGNESTPSVHFGTLSAAISRGATFIEFDALIDHGNSGGPLFDVKTAEVLGVVSDAIQVNKSSLVHNGFAIPANLVKGFIEDAYLPTSTSGSSTFYPCRMDYNNSSFAKETNDEQKRWCTLPDAVP